MFKKLHSNRDPRDTVFSELRKEFKVYFDLAGTWLRKLIDRYPGLLFGSMVIVMLVSLALSFTVFRPRPVPLKSLVPVNTAKGRKAEPVTDGFNQIIRVGAALKETISLRKLVDSITAKTTLSKADSVVLENALDRLQQMNKQLKPKP